MSGSIWSGARLKGSIPVTRIRTFQIAQFAANLTGSKTDLYLRADGGGQSKFLCTTSIMLETKGCRTTLSFAKTVTATSF
jgi:hypothetical protein